MHLSMLSIRVWGWTGYPWEIDSASFFLGGADFDIWIMPWGREFDTGKTCFGKKAVPTGGNLQNSRRPEVENLTLALVKMSNSPGSAPPPPTLRLNIDRCIIPYEMCCTLTLRVDTYRTCVFCVQYDTCICQYAHNCSDFWVTANYMLSLDTNSVFGWSRIADPIKIASYRIIH